MHYFLKKKEKLSLFIHTTRYLKPSQFIAFLVRRFLPPRRVDVKHTPDLRAIRLQDPISTAHIVNGEHPEILFLNSSREMPPTNVNWNPDTESRLWRYNLHYFDYLRDKTSNVSSEWISDWIQNNPQGSIPGWEPFTTSLRIVNWIFYLTKHPEHQTAKILQSLYTQTLWLEKNDEKHILANHYFENLKALLFAGIFFNSSNAKRWLRRGIQEIVQQLSEQTLSDGGHYERTPQYHSLMLENYLDILNLAINNPSLVNERFTETTRTHSMKGLQFQDQIQFPDGNLPLFNDTSLNTTQPLQTLVEYAKLLGLQITKSKINGMINLPDSGYLGYRYGEDMLIMDIGDIGPTYQPGHTHCDLLSFELMLLGQKIVVDTGVYEYEPGDMRSFVRSTKAHNTISIDGLDQSEVWGEFRVARRAKILSKSTWHEKNIYVFHGAFRGFHKSSEKLIHQREIFLETKNDESIRKIRVKDTISGNGKHLVESYIHLHPEITISRKENTIQLIRLEKCVATVNIKSDVSTTVNNGYYCPEFGAKHNNIYLKLTTEHQLPVNIEYEFESH